MNNRFDALIIGAGASGMMCAIAAKKKNPHLRVAIIEKNDRVGKKLLATGNGRCNLTNQHIDAVKYAGSFRNQARSIFSQYDCAFLRGYFETLGLLTYADNAGRVYPISRQASTVLDVIRFGCERLGVEIFCNETICSLKKRGVGFAVKTKEREFYSDKLVIACGSKAAPKLGGSAVGADFLKNFGHSVMPFSPALCPLSVKSDILKSLKGLRANGRVSLLRGTQTVKTEDGEIQFADGALSGICVFNLSLYAKQGDVILVDLLNNNSEKKLYNILIKNKKLFSQLTMDNLLTGILQKRLAQAVMKAGGLQDFSRLCDDLTDMELKKIAKQLKNMRFEIGGKAGFEQAQCAMGGVAGKEIDEITMQSKKVRNLFVCGEAIDICGECGGFNLHFAFVSGLIAGEHL